MSAYDGAAVVNIPTVRIATPNFTARETPNIFASLLATTTEDATVTPDRTGLQAHAVLAASWYILEEFFATDSPNDPFDTRSQIAIAYNLFRKVLYTER